MSNTQQIKSYQQRECDVVVGDEDDDDDNERMSELAF